MISDKPTVSLQGVGVRFTKSRGGERGPRPRLIGSRRRYTWGLSDVTFDLNPGEVVGLIGDNGAGKTTLLRTIAGIYRPDTGRISVTGRVGPILSLSGGLSNDLTGRENTELSLILLGLTRKEALATIDRVEEVADLGPAFDAQVRTYSAGMKARLSFGCTASIEPRILVLDEIIMFGDRSFRDRVQSFFVKHSQEGRTVVLASHEVDALASMCDRLCHLEQGRLVRIGPSDEVRASYLERVSASRV